MATITVRLDADLVIDVMLLSGVRDAQDAIEVVVRDYLARAHRTDAVTGSAPDARRPAKNARPPPPEPHPPPEKHKETAPPPPGAPPRGRIPNPSARPQPGGPCA